MKLSVNFLMRNLCCIISSFKPWNTTYKISRWIVPVSFNKQNGNFVCRQVPAEEEQHLVIVVHSRSSIEVVATTAVPGFVTIGHGVPLQTTTIGTRSGATAQVSIWEVIYQTRKAVFDHFSKHREESFFFPLLNTKYSAIIKCQFYNYKTLIII